MWQVIWNPDPGGNVDKFAQHGLSPEDVNAVLRDYESEGISRSSRLPCVFGYTADGRYIMVVFKELAVDTIYPVTAYDVPEPAR
jgi:uncharacterized DUF497 family protein